MSTTTTNFGWTIPSDTDLVKDGASAIRTLANGIDTSMADLEGGTTGQILSKTSGTDMDFTWIDQNTGDITGVTAGTGISGGGTSGTVTITNSMATAIDAKGDLIAGTAADTFSRLAVGTNGYILTADSAESTGIKWAAPASNSALTKITTVNLSSSSSFNINGCFSDTYDNYIVEFSNMQGSGASYASFGLRTGSTNSTASYSYAGYYMFYTSATVNPQAGTSQTKMDTFEWGSSSTTNTHSSLILSAPYKATNTCFAYEQQTPDAIVRRTGMHTLATSYDSMWFSVYSGTVSGNITIYGLAK